MAALLVFLFFLTVISFLQSHDWSPVIVLIGSLSNYDGNTNETSLRKLTSLS